jgi:DNA (cytosine-5)-methyltransferase 1
MPTFYELFAGGGFVRTGLGSMAQCTFANDFDAGKALSYRRNFGKDVLKICDVADLTPADLPGHADLLTMSTPCQDISQAGTREGITGKRSSAFFPAWALVKGLVAEGRPLSLILLENVDKLLTSHGGADIALVRALYEDAGYRFFTVVIDARHFVAQSRARAFVIGVRAGLDVDVQVLIDKAVAALPPPTTRLIDILKPARCHTPSETAKLISLMQPLHQAKIEEMRRAGRWVARAYKDRQGRFDANGNKIRAIEIRDDEIAGALLTGGGGASVQGFIAVNGAKTLSRKFTPREYAELQGIPSSYVLPDIAGKAYDLVGDGVCVPVIRHLAQYVLEPILAAVRER